MDILCERSLTRPLQMSVLHHRRDPAAKVSSGASPWSHPSWLYRAGGHLAGHGGDKRGSSATAFFWLDEGNVAVRCHVPDDFVKPLFEPGTRGKWTQHLASRFDSTHMSGPDNLLYRVLQWHDYFIQKWDHTEQFLGVEQYFALISNWIEIPTESSRVEQLQ